MAIQTIDSRRLGYATIENMSVEAEVVSGSSRSDDDGSVECPAYAES
jgi:hypothetical protein